MKPSDSGAWFDPSQPLVWDKRTVAKKLSVSERTVTRLVDRGKLACVHIGRSIRIPVDSVHKLLDSPALKGDNHSRVGSAVPEKSICHINAKTVRIGGQRSPTQAAKELDALLELPTARKRKPSKQSSG